MCKPIFQQFIDTTRFFLDISNLLIVGNIQELHMLIIDKWIIQIIVLIVKFNDRSFQVQTFFHAKTFRKRTRSHVTKNNLQRNDFHFLVELFCVRNTFDKVSSHTRSIQFFKNKRRNLIIEHTFAFNSLFTSTIQHGSLILINGPNHMFVFCSIDIFSFSRINKFAGHFIIRLSYYLSSFYHNDK